MERHPRYDGTLGTAGGAEFGAALQAAAHEKHLNVPGLAEASGLEEALLERLGDAGSDGGGAVLVKELGDAGEVSVEASAAGEQAVEEGAALGAEGEEQVARLDGGGGALALEEAADVIGLFDDAVPCIAAGVLGDEAVFVEDGNAGAGGAQEERFGC